MANDMFKEFKNNINERTNVNKRWAIIKSTVTEVASKVLKENKATVLKKECITAEIAKQRKNTQRKNAKIQRFI